LQHLRQLPGLLTQAGKHGQQAVQAFVLLQG
jgi:hypothetical protein